MEILITRMNAQTNVKLQHAVTDFCGGTATNSAMTETKTTPMLVPSANMQPAATDLSEPALSSVTTDWAITATVPHVQLNAKIISAEMENCMTELKCVTEIKPVHLSAKGM